MSAPTFPACSACGGARVRDPGVAAHLVCQSCGASFRIERVEGGTFYVPLPHDASTEPRLL